MMIFVTIPGAVEPFIQQGEGQGRKSSFTM